jgi:hypothetical protein
MHRTKSKQCDGYPLDKCSFDKNGDVKLSFANVKVAEGGGRAVRSHKLVGRIYTLHVMHKAKGRVSFDIVRIIHELHGLSEKVNGLLHGALRAPIEILAGPLSDPNLPVPSSRMVVADIRLKTRRSNVVVMQVNSIHDTSVTLGEEALDPCQSIWIRAGGWRHEVISESLERLNVRLPKLDTVTDRHVGLSRLINFIHTKNSVTVPSLDKTRERAYLVVTPQHGNALEAEAICLGGTLGTPGIQPRNSSRFVLGERGVITIRPSKTNLGTAERTARVHGSATRGSIVTFVAIALRFTLRFAIAVGGLGSSGGG